MNKNLIIVNTDEESRQLCSIINQDTTSIMSLQRQDFHTKERFKTVLFCDNTTERIKSQAIENLKHYNCIDKNTQIIYLKNMFKQE
jgi:hypothetical protein